MSIVFGVLVTWSVPSRIAGVVFLKSVNCYEGLVTWSVASRIAGVVVGVVAVSEQGSRGRLLSWSLSEPPTVLLRLWLWL